jgi:polar amino acid transport system substrate-binding protein
VLGYFYPALNSAFVQGIWIRDDARRQELTLRKLIVGRYDYALSNELSLAWVNRARPAEQKMRIIQ